MPRTPRAFALHLKVWRLEQRAGAERYAVMYGIDMGERPRAEIYSSRRCGEVRPGRNALRKVSERLLLFARERDSNLDEFTASMKAVTVVCSPVKSF